MFTNLIKEYLKEISEGVTEPIRKMEEGRCYSNAYIFLRTEMLSPDARLVHGEVTNGSTGKRWRHAWVEDGDTVYDPTTGVKTSKDLYYEKSHATVEDKYTLEEIEKMRKQLGHTSPYSEEEVNDVLWRRKEPETDFKKTIKEHLSSLTEGPQRSTVSDYLRTTYRTAILTNQYKHDSYFMGEDQGEFIAAAIVDIRGNVRISQVGKVPAGDLKSQRLGITRDTKDYMQFYIMAGRGIEHPDTEKAPDFHAQTRGGVHQSPITTHTKTVHLQNPIQADGQLIKTIDVQVPSAGSPASDAQIKTYLLYGPMIIDFVEKNLATPIGYNDGKAPEIRNNMDPKKKIAVIRKDAEDSIAKQRIPRVDFIQSFEEFKHKFIDTLTPDEQITMDTNAMTKKFVEFYIQKTGPTRKTSTLSLPPDDADAILKKQADLEKKYAAMRARRG